MAGRLLKTLKVSCFRCACPSATKNDLLDLHLPGPMADENTTLTVSAKLLQPTSVPVKTMAGQCRRVSTNFRENELAECDCAG